MSTCDTRIRQISIADIVSAVSRQTGISVADILGRSRFKHIVEARHLAMHLALKLTRKSTVTVGHEIGGRDHSTVLHAQRKIQRLLLESPALRAMEAGVEVLLGLDPIKVALRSVDFTVALCEQLTEQVRDAQAQAYGAAASIERLRETEKHGPDVTQVVECALILAETHDAVADRLYMTSSPSGHAKALNTKIAELKSAVAALDARTTATSQSTPQPKPEGDTACQT